MAGQTLGLEKLLIIRKILELSSIYFLVTKNIIVTLSFLKVKHSFIGIEIYIEVYFNYERITINEVSENTEACSGNRT